MIDSLPRWFWRMYRFVFSRVHFWHMRRRKMFWDFVVHSNVKLTGKINRSVWRLLWILTVLLIGNNCGPSSRIVWPLRHQSVDLYRTDEWTADTSKQDQDLTRAGQDLPPSAREKPPKDTLTEKENGSEKDGSTVSTASAKIQTLHNNKKSAKTRLTKAKNLLRTVNLSSIQLVCLLCTLFT